MIFTLKMESENDDSSRLGVAEMLNQVVYTFRDREEDSGPIVDKNGNKVGEWEFTDYDDDDGLEECPACCDRIDPDDLDSAGFCGFCSTCSDDYNNYNNDEEGIS